MSETKSITKRAPLDHSIHAFWNDTDGYREAVIEAETVDHPRAIACSGKAA